MDILISALRIEPKAFFFFAVDSHTLRKSLQKIVVIPSPLIYACSKLECVCSGRHFKWKMLRTVGVYYYCHCYYCASVYFHRVFVLFCSRGGHGGTLLLADMHGRSAAVKKSKRVTILIRS